MIIDKIEEQLWDTSSKISEIMLKLGTHLYNMMDTIETFKRRNISPDKISVPRILPLAPSTPDSYTKLKTERGQDTLNYDFFLNIFKPIILRGVTSLPPKRRYEPRQEVLRYQPVVKKFSQQYGVPENMIMAVMHQESNGQNRARADTSTATGLMQLVKGTAIELGLTVNSLIDERLNPEKNIEAGTKYLSQLLKRSKGDISLAIAAYHEGFGGISEIRRRTMREGNGRYAREKLKEEGRQYLPSVLKYMQVYKGVT